MRSAFLVAARAVGRSPARGRFRALSGTLIEPRPRRLKVGTKPAIAILPFVNQSDDPAREYFADGLTQDIINALGRFSGLTVMSWNAVLPYKGRPASPGRSPAILRCAIRWKAASARPVTACA